MFDMKEKPRFYPMATNDTRYNIWNETMPLKTGTIIFNTDTHTFEKYSGDKKWIEIIFLS